MTALIINFKDSPRPNLLDRTQKLTLTSLALAIEEFSYDKQFCREARSALRRHGDDNICKVSPEVYQKVTRELQLESAVACHLYASEEDQDV